jgi:aspartokinase/homoserine dehydrogenase 1
MVKKNSTLVMKFGGSSVGNVEAFDQATNLVINNSKTWKNLLVVVSAISGITDLLLSTAENAVKGDGISIQSAAQRLREVHGHIIDELVHSSLSKERIKADIDQLIDYFINLNQAITVLGEGTPRALDAIAGIGERLCARIFAYVLNEKGTKSDFVEASNLIVTDEVYQAAHPDMELTRINTQAVIDPLFKSGIIPVVTGFIAATKDGILTTLGRGGSDYTASIMGAVLGADDVWIWTDVDGVMSADPRLVSDARTIPELSFREIAELAYYGAKVVHPKTMRPVIDAGIGIRVCNTFNPENPGTRLTLNSESENNGKIKAVTAIRGQSLITIEGRGMLGVPGVAARAFSSVAATGTSVPLITQASSEQSICFAIPLGARESVLKSLENAFSRELSRRDIDRIWATEDVVIVTLVGAGMRSTPGVAGQIFGKLGEKNVNVIAIAQGSSEVSISLVVDDIDAENAVCVLHELITNYTSN